MRNILFALLLISQVPLLAQTKVMTYNIRNSNAMDGVNRWNLRRESLVGLVRKVDPDILGTQEVLIDQLKYLKKSLNDYESFGVGRNDGKHKGEHSALFFKKDKYELVTGSNFWLSETPQVPGSKSWDAAITRICSWVELKDKSTGNVFFVFNTHFDHKGVQARRNSAALIRRTIDSLAGDHPVIAIGDFNLVPSDPGYATMTDKKDFRVQLNDSYMDGALPYTDCGFEVSNKKCSRIDYIFSSPQYSKNSYTVHTDNNGTYYPSDHLTISVVLTLGNEKK
ncbi:MAG: endonuclease/exonuclease/phosphatase family protein [Bacteroidetes bacterium]|nr:endonuclease/exonuclease/phosphatase family protein [Bacteroidota bacterium]